jgi:hypothetical protein
MMGKQSAGPADRKRGRALHTPDPFATHSPSNFITWRDGFHLARVTLVQFADESKMVIAEPGPMVRWFSAIEAAAKARLTPSSLGRWSPIAQAADGPTLENLRMAGGAVPCL